MVRIERHLQAPFGKDRADAEVGEDLVFLGVHRPASAEGSIVEAGQVQQAVEGVEEQFVGQRMRRARRACCRAIGVSR